MTKLTLFFFQITDNPKICLTSSLWVINRNFATNIMEINCIIDSTTNVTLRFQMESSTAWWWLDKRYGNAHWQVYNLGGKYFFFKQILRLKIPLIFYLSQRFYKQGTSGTLPFRIIFINLVTLPLFTFHIKVSFFRVIFE
jgi:hypothetical protein